MEIISSLNWVVADFHLELSKWASKVLIFRKDFSFFFVECPLFPSSVRQRYVICAMNIIAITVSLGARYSFSIILTQMVIVPNLNQSPSQSHEIVCPVNAMQEIGHGNETNTVSEKN